MKRLVLTVAILIGLAAPAWAGLDDALCRHEREPEPAGWHVGAFRVIDGGLAKSIIEVCFGKARQ